MMIIKKEFYLINHIINLLLKVKLINIHGNKGIIYKIKRNLIKQSICLMIISYKMI